MQSTRNTAVSILIALVFAGGALPALGDACLDFKWDVSQERALYRGTPTELTAGKNPKSAPLVVPNRLYSLRLAAQDQVAFTVASAKAIPIAGAFAGLATLKIAAPGSYRIAIDLPFWIDVVSNGTLLQPSDFQGQHACSAPHKIVQFDLVGVQPYVLQFSNAASEQVLLTVTRTPPRKL
jgi:hypothetical protein